MKKVWIGVAAFLLIVAFVCGYAVFDALFPKAKPISCPDAKSVTAMTLVRSNGDSFQLGTADFGEVLRNISEAKPTREVSVNDHPSAKVYYIIQVDTEERQYRYFLYAEGSRVYLEHPYEGIYRSSQRFLNFVAGRFEGG